MGLGSWIPAGRGASGAARLTRAGRTRRWWPEALSATVVAFAAGLAATALDFGGWKELDWRAGAFAFCCAFAAIGLLRTIYERFR